MNDDSLTIAFSKRTLQRDLSEIRNLFGVDIAYSKSPKGYYIVEDDLENMNFQRMMEAFDLFNSLNISQDLTQHILLEKRRPQGTENLYGLLHAIKNRLQIRFTYQKFWEEEITHRTAEPYALKEFNNRWYIIAKNLKDGQTKSFALDRLSDLEITNQIFTLPLNLNIEQTYRYCFGIMSPTEPEPSDIILSFEPGQGKYIKTLPLHETQKIMTDDENQLIIKLTVYPTHDFVMELLSYGERLRVLEPQSLVREIKEAHRLAYQRYQNS